MKKYKNIKLYYSIKISLIKIMLLSLQTIFFLLKNRSKTISHFFPSYYIHILMVIAAHCTSDIHRECVSCVRCRGLPLVRCQLLSFPTLLLLFTSLFSSGITRPIVISAEETSHWSMIFPLVAMPPSLIRAVLLRSHESPCRFDSSG